MVDILTLGWTGSCQRQPLAAENRVAPLAAVCRERLTRVTCAYVLTLTVGLLCPTAQRDAQMDAHTRVFAPITDLSGGI
jgi:hypothetical protein